MGRVCGKNQRVFGAWAIPANRMHVFVEIVEGSVRQPGFVEMQCVHAGAQNFLEHFHVVNHAVVGRLGNGQYPRLQVRILLHRGARERICRNFRFDGFGLEFAIRNRPDDAQVIARGRKKDRYRTSHRDRMQNRLVTVAVHQHNVVRCHRVMPDHLVRRGSAVGDEKAVVGVEDARRIALRSSNWSGMVEQLAQLFHRVAHIRAQHVFAEELVKHLPNW